MTTTEPAPGLSAAEAIPDGTRLREFIGVNREAILAQARSRAAARNAPSESNAELAHGLPAFLDQLGEALRKTRSHEAADHTELTRTATQHGDDLFRGGLTVGQVVHGYGDLCQVITGLAVKQKAPIDAEEFRTLNLCLDDAIAMAVTEWGRLREGVINGEDTERLGVLAHEMRNLLNTALMSFESIKAGVVAPGGSTSAMLERSLTGLVALVDRSMADVRLESGKQNIERVAIWELIGEVEIGTAMLARQRGLSFVVEPVDRAVVVQADRQILAATLFNLLQNALKFTKRGTTIRLRTTATETRVLIAVEDECGGLPPAQRETLLKPFTQGGGDLTGLGLGLSICLKAVKAIGGALRIDDLPGKGCIFTIDLPKSL